MKRFRIGQHTVELSDASPLTAESFSELLHLPVPLAPVSESSRRRSGGLEVAVHEDAFDDMFRRVLSRAEREAAERERSERKEVRLAEIDRKYGIGRSQADRDAGLDAIDKFYLGGAR